MQSAHPGRRMVAPLPGPRRWPVPTMFPRPQQGAPARKGRRREKASGRSLSRSPRGGGAGDASPVPQAIHGGWIGKSGRRQAFRPLKVEKRLRRPAPPTSVGYAGVEAQCLEIDLDGARLRGRPTLLRHHRGQAGGASRDRCQRPWGQPPRYGRSFLGHLGARPARSVSVIWFCALRSRRIPGCRTKPRPRPQSSENDAAAGWPPHTATAYCGTDRAWRRPCRTSQPSP
jgi:hypothetical protein